VFFVIEVFGARRIHPIQYLLVGGALVLFYLLVLSLAEHVGFAGAYAASAISTVTLIAGYAAAALESRRRAVAVGGLLVGLYGFLYVLLALEEFSLLVGSVGIFSILATIMLVSRRVDWYELGRK
jgi:inner membrane protein